MKTLREIAEKYHVDKLTYHHYIDTYEQLLAPIRESAEYVMEIGIGYEELMRSFVKEYVHWASLRMWAEYFPNAVIWGLDNHPEALSGFSIYDDDDINLSRVKTNYADQRNPKDFFRLLPTWDFIVDDGSHQTDHQILSVACLYPKLNSGGIYVIEDVKEPERIVEAVGGGWMWFDKNMVDDCLVIIRK